MRGIDVAFWLVPILGTAAVVLLHKLLPPPRRRDEQGRLDEARREEDERAAAARREAVKRGARALESIRTAGDVVPIGIAKDGVVRIHGTARALSPNRPVPTIAELAVQATDSSRRLERGRFAIIDSSGVAIVESAHVEVWSTETDAEVPVRMGAEIAEGAPVTVVGAARLVTASVATPLAAAGYREPPHVLLFEGQEEEPILVLVHV